ncbi:MAG: exodeoxyribonuclease-3 [Oleiphilaceae bacterium]|jgi:exodeoxyribonuclease-3
MRVVSINVNGLKRAAENGFFDWMREINADVVCVQDIQGKVYDFDDEIFHPEGYQAYFIDAENPEDGGVGIYTRHFPKAIMYGFAYEPADREGRFIQADFENVSVACMLAPCALGDESKQQAKDDFQDAFKNHLDKTLRKRRQFIFAGSFHSAHLVTDASKKYHEMDISGFKSYEREWFDTVFDDLGYVDAFRYVNVEKNQYTWWPEWAKGWRKNSGWRTDYQITSQMTRNLIEDGFIDFDTRFSDHAPLVMEYDVII